MKILHFIYDDPQNKWCGGGGSFRVNEINKILSKEHSIIMVTGNYPGFKNEKYGNLEIVRAGSPRNYLFSRMSYALKAHFMLKKYNPDIVVNDFSVFSPVFCEFFTQKKVIASFYHFIGNHAFKKYSVFGIIPFLAEKLLLKISKYFITISPSVTKILESKVKKDRKIKCIYTGISDILFDSEGTDGDYIAYMGRIDIYMKGLDTLLQAVGLLKNEVKLKIAGIGKEKDINSLKRMISDLGMEDRVEFLGSLSENEKREYLSNSMFTVMPSRFEGWGIAAIEAQACGKAVVGTDIPGLRDAIKNNETGILVKPEDPESLKHAIEELIQNKEKRTSFGDNGKLWANNFKWDNIANDQINYYISILDS